MNGSRSARSTPAKARRTGNPSPSNPRGALVMLRTGRGRATAGSGSGTRGRMVMSSTTTAGMVFDSSDLPRPCHAIVDYATEILLGSATSPSPRARSADPMPDFNHDLIADLRAHDGHPT